MSKNTDALKKLEDEIKRAIEEYQQTSGGLIPQVVTLNIQRRGQEQTLYVHSVKVLVGTR